MAVLTQPHWETVTPQLRDVLQLVSRQAFADRFYLAGGTALALHIGHRPSIDLDFFADHDELLDASRQAIITALEQRAAVEVREDVIGNLLLKVNQLSVGFSVTAIRSWKRSAFPVCCGWLHWPTLAS